MKKFSQNTEYNQDFSFLKKNKLSKNIKDRFLLLAVDRIYAALNKKNKKNKKPYDCKNALREILGTLDKTNILSRGTLSDEKIITLICILFYYKPTFYVESGFFRGASLFCAQKTSFIKKILAFDPDHSNLRISLNSSQTKLLKYDFSDYNFIKFNKDKSIVFFDDHINCAERILQAYKKGFKYLVFDDSFGLTGTTTEKYPPFPSIQFIQNYKELNTNDFFYYTYFKKININLIFFKLSLMLPRNLIRINFKKNMLNSMKLAYSFIDEVIYFPRLDNFILKDNPSCGNLILIKLKD